MMWATSWKFRRRTLDWMSARSKVTELCWLLVCLKNIWTVLEMSGRLPLIFVSKMSVKIKFVWD